MKVIHITPSSTGYQIVELLAHRVSRNNGFAVIKLDNGEIHMTGGYIVTYDERITKLLDEFNPEEQYKLVGYMKSVPYDSNVKLYYQNDTREITSKPI